MKRAQEEWKHDKVWPQKVIGSLEVSDLLDNPKGHGDLCGQFDLVYGPKMSRGH